MTNFWKQFIKDRKKSCRGRLLQTHHYRELHYLRKQSAEEVEKILLTLPDEHREVMRLHADRMIKMTGLELKEMYIQGLRDCLHILEMFGAFDVKEEDGDEEKIPE